MTDKFISMIKKSQAIWCGIMQSRGNLILSGTELCVADPPMVQILTLSEL